jgi:hypothetical protein
LLCCAVLCGTLIHEEFTMKNEADKDNEDRRSITKEEEERLIGQ